MSSASNDSTQFPLKVQELTRRQFITAAATILPALSALPLPISDPTRLAQVEGILAPLGALIVRLIDFQAELIGLARYPEEGVDAAALFQSHLDACLVPAELEKLLLSVSFEKEVCYLLAGEKAYLQAVRKHCGED